MFEQLQNNYTFYPGENVSLSIISSENANEYIIVCAVVISIEQNNQYKVKFIWKDGIEYEHIVNKNFIKKIN